MKKWDALIRSYLDFLPRCGDEAHEAVTAEIARLRELQRSESEGGRSE